MAWPKPTSTRNQVRKAGKLIVAESKREDDLFLQDSFEAFEVVQNWRAAHGAVLNTAQAWLRRLETFHRPTVGQRLKRFETIIDKLVTGRAMDLSTMHDIAGVRAIFRDENQLREFQEKALRSKAQHVLMHDLGKFDYIKSPKKTGYRGVHQVYERQVPASSGQPWNGLKFEVQLRTSVQHSWATAVEIYDSTAHARFKFEESANPAYEQFLIISELFARVHEGGNASLASESDNDLMKRHYELESTTHMVATIQSLRVAHEVGVLRQNTILQRSKDGKLNIFHYPSLPAAIRAISEMEKREETENTVLVGAATPQHIRIAFKNYFDDTDDFVKLLRAVEAEMGTNPSTKQSITSVE